MKLELNINPPAKSRGVALLTVLLIVAIATITAVSMASRQQVDIRKTENILRMDQAWHYVLGIDSWALGRLREDREENKTDSGSDSWNSPISSTAVEGGEVEAKIEDQQGRFNLNNLVQDGKPSAPDIARFRRLLEALGQNSNLADAVVDWIDQDNLVRFPGGAEDDAYSMLERSYRTANTMFAHPSELLLVQGFDVTICEVLYPHITVLPESVTINVNSATAPVLMSLAKNMTNEDAQRLKTDREDQPFTSVEAFLTHTAVAGLGLDESGLSVDSKFFRVAGEVRIGRTQIRHNTLIHRQPDGKTKVVQRTRKGLFDE